MTQETLEYCSATHPGLKRDNNEDCYVNLPAAGLWAVADGMGGHEAGEVASAIVSETLDNFSNTTKPFSLVDAIQQAHYNILDAAERGRGAFGMGSTVVALHSQNNHYQVAWVGDSRAYLWSPDPVAGGVLERLTTDHSYVQMLFQSGAITEDEVEIHPDKNIITQCLGMQELKSVKVDTCERPWQIGQWILLCSDGLTDELNDQEIAEILQHAPNSFTAVDELMHQALTHGGRDNVTVQIIESPKSPQAVWGRLQDSLIPKITESRRVDKLLFSGLILVLSAIILRLLLFHGA